LIGCLAERIWRVCSEQQDRLVELDKLKTILLRNDYPLDIIEKTLQRFIEQKAKERIEQEIESSIRVDKRFLKLPFINKKCDDFSNRLKTLVHSFFPTVDFTVAFQAPLTIGKLFPFKDNIKLTEEKSLVVYCLKCIQCGVEYIGKTERILCHRINEHKKDKESACRQHMDENPSHQIDFDNPEIIDTADNDKKLCVKELLHIISRKPELNKQLGKQSKHEIKTLLIRAYPQFRKKD
jgi:hypothetical protein